MEKVLGFEDARIYQQLEVEADLYPVTFSHVRLDTSNTRENNRKRLLKVKQKLSYNLSAIEGWVKHADRNQKQVAVARTYYRQTKALENQCDQLIEYTTIEGEVK